METMKNKVFPNPEWLHRMAEAEDRCPSIAVGGLAHDMGMLQAPAAEGPKVFGRLIEYARREKGLSVEALAEAANVELAEVVAIETESNVVPMPRTVFQLAQSPLARSFLNGISRVNSTSTGIEPSSSSFRGSFRIDRQAICG